MVTSDIAWIISHNEVLFLHILPEIQASFKDLKQFLKNVENYLYGTMQNLFGVWWNKQAAREYAAKHPEEEKSADNDNSGLYY
ncbi:hypothetical protein TUW04_00170 (plasmid) [Lactiplantibacillus plantarum]|nr:hypothetical protein TUW04_00170 [Lactiplantibacillus plantarum]